MKKQEKKPGSLGRAQFVEKLHAKGFSRREAKRTLNIALDAMMEGLEQDGEVEFPLGKLVLVRHRHRKQEGMFLGKKRTIYRRCFTVVHELDEKLDKLLNPPPIPTRPRFVLPPRPSEKSQKPVPKKITARGRRKEVQPTKAAETSVGKSRKHRILLPPRLSSKPPGPLQRSLARLRHLELAVGQSMEEKGEGC